MQLVNIPEWLSGELTKAISWTLIHSLWQGLIAAVLAGLIVMCTRYSKAQLRYNLLSALFALFLITTGITFLVECNVFRQSDPLPGMSVPSFKPDVSSVDITAVRLPASETSSYLGQFVNYFNQNASIIALVWFFFFVARCVKMIRGFCEVRGFSSCDVHHPSQYWQKKLDALKQMLGIRKEIRLLESKRIKIPMTMGYFKATILIPIGLLANLPSDQVESILLHELAHIKRKDYLVNFMQSLAETVFFFNPAVLWISSLIREEREACCDDMVVENLPEKRSYLEALVSFQEYTMGTGAYAMGFAGRKAFLLTRVKRLLTNENKKLNLFEKSILLASVVLITAFSFIDRIPAIAKPPVIVPAINNLQLSSKNVIKAHDANIQQHQDTTPPKKHAKEKVIDPDSKFISVIYDKTNDPQVPVLSYEAIDRNANKYRITKENGQLVALSINGKQIPASELSNHQDLFRRIESFIQLTNNQKRQSMANRATEQADNTLVMNRNTTAKNKNTVTNEDAIKSGKNKFDNEKNIEHDHKNMESDHKNMESSHKNVENNHKNTENHETIDNDKSIELNHQNIDNNHKSINVLNHANPKKKANLDESWKKDAERIKGVLQELVSEGVVTSVSSVDWFGINDTKMMVNGKEVPAALHSKLKSKYGIEKNMGLFYGPSQLHGSGIWFDKTDIHPVTQ